MTQKKTDFSGISAVLAAGAIVVAAVAPGFYMVEPENGLTEEQVKTLMEDALSGLNLTDADKVDAIYADIFKTDAWEAEAEVLALEELEDDNYEELFEDMKGMTGVTIDDEKDIDRVVVKEVEFRLGDADDKDMFVDLELKVYYENHDGDDKKVYINATVEILDGEVEDIDFFLVE